MNLLGSGILTPKLCLGPNVPEVTKSTLAGGELQSEVRVWGHFGKVFQEIILLNNV